jgi:hypothetical protein
MIVQVMLASALFILGLGAFGMAVRQERLMHRFRQPGTSYREATLRVDGGWRRSELFTPEGLAHQRRASGFGLAGAALWIAALGVWIGLGWR